VHRRLLAGLHDADDVGDQALGQEVVEGRPADLVVVELLHVQPGVLSVGVGMRGAPTSAGNAKSRPFGTARRRRRSG
jgi:hypothetical protein